MRAHSPEKLKNYKSYLLGDPRSSFQCPVREQSVETNMRRMEQIQEWTRVAREELGWSDETVIGQMWAVMAGFRDGTLHDHTCHLASIVDRKD